MYGSLSSCKLSLLDSDHVCDKSCRSSQRTVSYRTSTGSRARSLSPAEDNIEPSQRLLPLQDVSCSTPTVDRVKRRMELEASGSSWNSALGGNSEGINSLYHDFGGSDPLFSIVSDDDTAEAIRLCERWILRPYKLCLRLIGWLPISQSGWARFAQGVVIVLWTLAIVFAMVTQILSCFRRDVFIDISEVTLTPPVIINDSLTTDSVTPDPISTTHPPLTCSDSIISALILPDIVLLLAYFFGVYLFSKGETEYLFQLASLVFIKNSESGNVSYNKKIIATIVAIFTCGFVWLLVSLGIRIISAFAGDLFDPDLVVVWPGGTRIEGAFRLVLVIFSLFGFFTFDLVYLFAVLNYAAQAEMNVYLVKDVASLIRQKSYEHIDFAIKDIRECKRYIKVLSRRTAILTALALFDLFTLSVNSLYDLRNVNSGPRAFLAGEENLQVLSAIAAGLNCAIWLILVILPFIQAARVTYTCQLLKDVGPEVRARPYVYENTPLLDLDSLMYYLQSIRLRASLFGVPIFPWMAYSVLVVFTFVMFILFQLGKFDSFSPYI